MKKLMNKTMNKKAKARIVTAKPEIYEELYREHKIRVVLGDVRYALYIVGHYMQCGYFSLEDAIAAGRNYLDSYIENIRKVQKNGDHLYISIPKKFADSNGIQAGDKCTFMQRGESLTLIPLRK